ncbi:MAG: DUF126 domain-containing protein [Zestosphaera sp.]
MVSLRVAKVFGADSVCGVLMVAAKPFSFLGDVTVDLAEVRGVGRIAGTILLAPAAVGSTVGPYVLYALSRRGLAPKALAVKSVDPALVAGCVLAGVSLYRLLDEGADFNALKALSGANACIEGGVLNAHWWVSWGTS